MTMLEQAKQDMIAELSKTNNVTELSSEMTVAAGFNAADTILSVETEYMDNGGIGHDLKLFIRLNPDFPLVIPTIFLPMGDGLRSQYLPHVDQKGLICTFDPDITRTDPSQPAEIVIACINRAKEILEDGLTGKNHIDFGAEFIAYWENKYGEADEIYNSYLNLVEGIPANRLKLIELETKVSGNTHVIYEDKDLNHPFLKYINSLDLKYTEQNICYIGEIPLSLKPPFALTNGNIDAVLSKANKSVRDAFIRYVNSKNEVKVVAATVIADGKPQLICWIQQPIKIVKTRKFRSGSTSNYMALKLNHSHDYVKRVSPKNYTLNRVALRTDGIVFNTHDKKKILVAGLGSVGSNLLYFLNTMTVPELLLIDPDLLILENINRHFLGFSYIGLNKAHALRAFFYSQNPLQTIVSKSESIVSLYNTDPESLVNNDYLFLATGKANIDEFICEQQKAGLIPVPIFLLWVEPYLSAGHLLYLHPGDRVYTDYFDSEGYFNQNVIKSEEYRTGNPLLSLREAGCQSTYVPYSQSNVCEYLAAAFPVIRNVIENGTEKSFAFTWIGDLQPLRDLGIQLDPERSQLTKGDQIMNS
jgi:hypothetical protein